MVKLTPLWWLSTLKHLSQQLSIMNFVNNLIFHPPFFGDPNPLLKVTVCVTSQCWEYWTQTSECIVIQRQLVLTLIPWLARIGAQHQTVIIVQACAGASWPFNGLRWILILNRIFHEIFCCWIISMITTLDHTVEDDSANMGKLCTKSRGFGSTRELGWMSGSNYYSKHRAVMSPNPTSHNQERWFHSTGPN